MSEVDPNFNLEALDYFCIVDDLQEIENPIGIKIKIMPDMEGAVFQALEVCPPMVAAKIIERDAAKYDKNLVISLNWRRHKISPVTKEYAEAIMNSRELPRGFDDFNEMDMEGFDHDEAENDFGRPSP